MSAPCEACAKPAKRKFHVAGRGWLCQSCIPTWPCETCGSPTRAGIERFALGSADSDDYSAQQALVFICRASGVKHRCYVALQLGPGAYAT